MERLAVANAAVWNGERAMASYLSGHIPEYLRYIANADRCWAWIRAERRKKKPRESA